MYIQGLLKLGRCCKRGCRHPRYEQQAPPSSTEIHDCAVVCVEVAGSSEQAVELPVLF